MQTEYMNTTISIIVTDFSGENVLLAYQAGADRYYLPAGVMNGWESEEEAVYRIVSEKTGLEAETLRFNRDDFFRPTRTRILNYVVQVTESAYLKNGKRGWMPLKEALQKLPEESQSRNFLTAWIRSSGRR